MVRGSGRIGFGAPGRDWGKVLLSMQVAYGHVPKGSFSVYDGLAVSDGRGG